MATGFSAIRFLGVQAGCRRQGQGRDQGAAANIQRVSVHWESGFAPGERIIAMSNYRDKELRHQFAYNHALCGCKYSG
jgi:hypothetical protein